ncbi:gliding motility-associated C-terminal domain-containing protein [Winogradskyella vidalii]|uniref:gliding motility-associated C-terminal domain-containing protein n=1 Tax=Winogradskyella vidalii TaxID=2615024 RepID=UPI0015C6F625|nr:gliding motility-associated C-terminal domain-containing protein [Winogradskyella vidalii]
MKSTIAILIIVLFNLPLSLEAQDIELFQQFNGRYDYTAIGNTLNTGENNNSSFCTILETSSATLSLDPNYTVISAYLYWAGSGLGDTEVTLNGTAVTADDTYNVFFEDTYYGELSYFSSYADITAQIINEGNTSYQFADADINASILANPGYCSNRTNFGGWSIYVIYQDDNLPLNQISLFQGLEIINRNVPEIEMTLTNVNVLDNEGARIGFLAWEGDNTLNYGESLSINDNIISNPPLNLADNAFNSTNSFTNSTTFYNGDLDVYDIENNIAIGDTEVSIKLTTGGYDIFGTFQADLIILNNIITVLNSQLPDATITITNYDVYCADDNVELFYTVNNFNSTDVLPSNTPIAFYSEGVLIGQSTTLNTINIGASESNSIILNLSEVTSSDINILAVIDDDGTQNGIVTETNENNNSTTTIIQLLTIPEATRLPDLIGCNEGLETATYNLFDALETVDYNEEDVTFYTSLEDLELGTNSISIPEDYNNVLNPETIYTRIASPPCYEIFQFNLTIENCPPYIPQGFSPNNDTKNDWFNIQDLYDIFTAHELQIYNRYGELIFVGNNDMPWNGTINKGLNNIGNKVPIGTYYYILNLNDPNYKPFVGWVYVNY